MAVTITIPDPVASNKTVYLAFAGDIGTKPSGGGQPHQTGKILDAFMSRYSAFPRWIAPLGDSVYLWGHYQDYYDDRFGIPWVYGGSSGGLTLQDKRVGSAKDHFLPVVGNHEGYADMARTNYSGRIEPEYFGFDHFWTIGGNDPNGGQPSHVGMGFTKAELGMPVTGAAKGRCYAKDLFANDGVAYWKFIGVNSDKSPRRNVDPAQYTKIAGFLADANNVNSVNHPGITQHVIMGMHHPPLASSERGNGEVGSRDFFVDLQAYMGGLKFLLSGHIHIYERFAPVRMSATGSQSSPATSSAASVTEGVIAFVAGNGGDNGLNNPLLTYNAGTGAGAHSDHILASTGTEYGASVMQLEPHRALVEHVPVDHATLGNFRDGPVTYTDPRKPIPGGGPPPPPPPGAPTIVSVTPANVVAGANVTIDGTGYATVAATGGVRFGGIVSTSYTIVSGTRITAQIPGTVPSGATTVTVQGTGGTSAAFPYNVGSTSTQLTARAVAIFPTATYKDESITVKRARLDGPRGGPYTCRVSVNCSTSTYPTGTTFAVDWRDRTNTPGQTNPVIEHVYTFRHAADWGYGLGRKDITVTLRTPAGATATVVVSIFLAPDHPLFGIWQDNDTFTFDQQEAFVARGIDSDHFKLSLTGQAPGSSVLTLPTGEMSQRANDTTDVGIAHVIPYAETHGTNLHPDGNVRSGNLTWTHHIKNRRQATPFTYAGQSWSALPKAPKDIWQDFARDLYAWGRPFIWGIHQEPDDDEPGNQGAWNAAFPAESVTVTPQTFCDFYDTVVGWIEEVVQPDGQRGVPNCIAFHVGLQGGTWRNNANGGPDGWLRMTKRVDSIGMSLYNNAPTAPWRDFDDSAADRVLQYARARGVMIFFGELGSGPDSTDPTRKATWFRDMLNRLAGRTAMPNGLRYGNLDLLGINWNSGNPGSFVDYRWQGAGVPAAVSQAAKDVFADNYTDWGFLTDVVPPPPAAPTITSFTPTQGSAGTVVQVTGTNLSGVDAVAFGGVSAAFSVVSATRLDATVSVGAITGRITVTDGANTATSATNFTFVPPAGVPTITSITPANAAEGSTVTIDGTGFDTVAATGGVRFGEIVASYTIVSPTRITATVPVETVPRLANSAEGGSQGTAVTVGNSGGASGTAFNSVVVTAGTLTFDSSRPHHGQLAYKSSQTGAVGSNYVAWDPATDLDVTYFRGYFNVDAIPTGANASIVHLIGTDANGMCSVAILTTGRLRLRDSALATIADSTTTLSPDTWYRIEVRVAKGASTGVIELRLYAGDSTTPLETMGPFTGRSLSSFQMEQVLVGADTSFSPETVVDLWFDDIALDAYSWIGPSTASPGNTLVTVTGTAGTSAPFPYTVGTTSAPAVSSFTPIQAAKGATIQISGSGFTGASAVRFGGVLADGFLVVSNTLIQATVPAGAISGAISVTVGGLTGTSVQNFTYVPPAEIRGTLRLRA